jgi:hypothetical protein
LGKRSRAQTKCNGGTCSTHIRRFLEGQFTRVRELTQLAITTQTLDAFVNKQIPNYLRLVTDTSLQPRGSENEDLAALERLCHAFTNATGWQLEYATGSAPKALTNLMWSAPVNPGVGTSPGHIRLLNLEGDVSLNDRAVLALEQAAPLAEAIGQMWGEVLTTRHALWQREAELAVGVPLVVRSDDTRAPSLGQRLEAVLKGGAEAIGCQAAALYLLDPATTELKLRSSWGLPRKRLTEPARPLRPALADLEALLGHAVVMDDPTLFDYWKVPEQGFRSCVCVPISSPSMPLGTLWIFCDRVRDFSDSETNIVEVVAGRLAADLERETLVDEAVATRHESHQIARAHRSQQEQLPSVAPMVDGWEIAAKAYHAGSLGGTFYDWFALDDGSLSIIAGDIRQQGLEGAMTANLVRGAARAFGSDRKAAHAFAEKASAILWASSAGDASVGLLHAILQPGAGVLEFCSAGPIRVMAIGTDSFVTLEGPSAALGQQESVRLATRHHPLGPDELILAYGTTFLGNAKESVLAAFDQRLALALEPYRGRSVSELMEVAGPLLEQNFGSQPGDRVLVLLKRRRS